MSLCMSVTLSAPTFQKSEAMSWRAQGLSKNIIANGLGVLGTREEENTAEVTAKAGSTSAGPLDREERQKRPRRTGHLSRGTAVDGSLERRTPIWVLSPIRDTSRKHHPPC